MAGLRCLVIVLGDQLDSAASAFDGFDASQDAVWMAEVDEESTHVPSSQQRIAFFLAAMRHFAQALRAQGRPLHYLSLDESEAGLSLATALQASLERLRPQRLVMTAPGDWRVLQGLRRVALAAGLPLEVRDDRHFFSTVREFAAHAQGRKTLRLEYFYRELRRRHHVLMQGTEPDAEPDGLAVRRAAAGSQPLGGQWNFDSENRQSFGAQGPGMVPARAQFAPDAITQGVLDLVARRFAHHPGTLASFAWPVTREQALQALAMFVRERLPQFGRYQDAMWPGEPWLYHSHLSAALNVKLLSAREVVAAAEAAYHAGTVPLASAEGFIRQILGWREYVRGVYWTQMPQYLTHNALDAQHDLPAWYWTGATDMACLRDAIQQTLAQGYAHHIQRLMVTGLFALLYGVQPQQVHVWYLSVYVDAVAWVEVPNTLGMSQFADGGLMASKPYAASGKYIERMGGGCAHCRYRPEQRTGELACPFTTLYWAFLLQHAPLLRKNPRMALQVQNAERMPQEERMALNERVARIRSAEVGAVATGESTHPGWPT